MPFAWASSDRTSSNSGAGAPSGRISALPQAVRTQGHNRGMTHSTSTSHLSSSARSASGSHFPSSLSMAKASGSAAQTNNDESDDFRRFLDEAQARDDRRRQRRERTLGALSANPSSGAREDAAESLRRVTSSSSLSVRSQRGVANTIAAPQGKSTLSTTTGRAPPARSVSNYSMNFRTPTSQFLEAQAPELGIDDTPVSGRSIAAGKSALGHAKAQVQSRNGTVRAKPVAPSRSSTIAVETPTAKPQPTPAPTARSQPLSPKRRPQSYAPTPSSSASPEKLGATGLGKGLPSSSGTKRAAEEMERSSSLQPSANIEAEASKMTASPSASSRRKTWFGLGWAGATEDTVAGEGKANAVKDEQMDEPPPPMNEDEAAFRRSLGFETADQKPNGTQDVARKLEFPTGPESEATATAQTGPAQISARERRVSWLPWRNVAPPPEPEVSSSEAQQQASSDAAIIEEHVQAVEDEAKAPVALELSQQQIREQGDETVTYRTVVKRGWMGARYEVQEPVQSLQDMFKVPDADAQTSQPKESNVRAASKAESTSTQAQAGQDKPADASYPPGAPPSTGDARHGSSTWRWRFWSGQEGQQQPSQATPTQPVEAPTHNGQRDMNVDAAEPMDIDPDQHLDAVPTAPEGGSWTYSSYLASWVATWVYNAQQQELEHQGQGHGQENSEPSGSTDRSQPRTPAEQVKADALARDTTAAVFDANKAVLNNTTKSRWIKFFASRSANLPREAREAVTNDDGMEVMDISEMEGASPRPAAAREASSSNGRLTLDVGRAPRARTATAGSAAGSKASSIAGEADIPRASTPVLSSKESVKMLGKTALIKAANISSASTLGLGKDKKAATAKAEGNSSSSGQAAKDASKGLSPNGGGGGPSQSGTSTPTKANTDPIPIAPPNLVLPSFEDTFTRAPRMWPPKVGVLERTLSAVNSYLFSKVPDLERMKRPTRYSTYGEASSGKPGAVSLRAVNSTQRLAGKAKATGTGSSKDKGVETALKEVAELAQRLPRAWSTVGLHERAQTRGTAGIGKIVVIGVHGWFTQSIFKNMIGEPTGTSAKFAAMQTESIRRHFLEAGLELNPEAITAISLQGDGKVADRVDRLFAELISRPNWVDDLKRCDALFLSAHSQGAIVATQLLARLIEQSYVQADTTRICLLAMCGIHHGPFAHLKSSITASYINYFETAAAKELFEFQSSSSSVYQQYTSALKIILDAGTKCVYVGSTDDNVVPIYSALNSSNNHPSILRALYIDGQAFPKVDFLTNLLVMCVAIRNAGLGDHNLLTLLSASVAGSLYGGMGHSKVYEERTVYDLATRYLFEVTHPLSEPTFAPGIPGANSHAASSSLGKKAEVKEGAVLVTEPFEAQRWNPYELPWSLRGLFEDKHVRSLFAEDMLNLLKSYEEWKPDARSKALKDLQWRLAPMRSIAPPPIEEGEDREEEREEEAAKGNTKGKANSKL